MIPADALPANEAPVAVPSSNVTSGETPMAVTFNSSVSYDSDGTIASYHWNFGDGASSTVQTQATLSAGSFNVTLTVTDDKWASSSESITITATEPTTDPNPPADTLKVSSIQMTLVQANGKGY